MSSPSNFFTYFNGRIEACQQEKATSITNNIQLIAKDSRGIKIMSDNEYYTIIPISYTH